MVIHPRKFRFEIDNQVRDALPMGLVLHDRQEVAAAIEVVKQFGALVLGHRTSSPGANHRRSKLGHIDRLRIVHARRHPKQGLVMVAGGVILYI